MNADQALQFLIAGLTMGAIYALVALGFTIIYNVTGIINFAQGEFVMLGGLLLYSFSNPERGAGLPLVIAVPLAIGGTTLVGLALERLGIAPARSSSVVVLIIVTIGASLILRGLAQITWGSDALPVRPFSGPGVVPVGGAVASLQSLWVLGVTLVVMGLLYLFFNRTLLGRAVSACGLNRYGATVIGIDVRQMSFLSFGLSAALGALGGALIAPIALAGPEMGVIGLKGFSAAVIGGLGSSPGAVLGGLILGVLEAFGAGYVSSAYKDALAFVALILVLLVRPEGLLGVRSYDVHAAGLDVLRRRVVGGGIRRREVNWSWVGVALVVLALPLVGNTFVVNLGVFIGLYSLVAIGLGLLMGYSGQISLGQAAFMGIGAYSSAVLTTKLGVPPLVALLAGIALSAVVALVVGRQIFRLAGHYLALATLAFGIVVEQVFDHWETVTSGRSGILSIPRLGVGDLILRGDLAYYYLVWLLVLVAILATLNLVDSRVGRALRAVASSEPGAEALGVDPAGYKVKVFVLSAALASLAGSLYAHFLGFIDPGPFGFGASLNFVIMAVLGGTTTVWVSPFGALVLVLLSQALQHFKDWNIVANGLILMGLLMFLPQGVVRAVGEVVARRAEGGDPRWRSSRTAGEGRAAVDGVGAQGLAPARAGARPCAPTEGPVLSIHQLRKRFGGIVALDDVSLEVLPGRITAVIGPNGAGKTTLFNLIAGVYRPDAGRIEFDGAPLEGLEAHRMPAIGLVRTFQNIQSFANMTVLDNVAVGRHPRSDSGFLAAALRLPRARAEERAIYAAARQALDLVGLSDAANTPCLNLPAGQQRLLAVARALATEPRLLLLDEPAAGLNRLETAELAALVRRLVDEQGMTVLLVEHDMGFVMSIADTVAVLDYGKKIAEGTPAAVRTDLRVIEAYLGGGELEPESTPVATP